MADLDVQLKKGYRETIEALNIAADEGVIEESEIDLDFYTMTRERGEDGTTHFKDGYEEAISDFLKGIQEGRRSICVTEGALKALGVETDSPKDYCNAATPRPREEERPAPPEPRSDPAPAPPRPDPEPTPLRPLPPLFHDWLTRRAGGASPDPVPATDPAPAATDEVGKKRAATELAAKKAGEAEGHARRATQALEAARKVTPTNDAVNAAIRTAESEARKAAEAAAEAKQHSVAAQAAPDSATAETGAKKAADAALKAKTAADAAEAARKAAEAAAKPNPDPEVTKADLSGALNVNKLPNRGMKIELSRVAPKELESYGLPPQGEYLPRIRVHVYIPGADYKKLFHLVQLLGVNGQEVANPGVGIVPDWTASWAENRSGDPKGAKGGTMTHTLKMVTVLPLKAGTIKVQSTVKYRIMDNLDGTGVASWRETKDGERLIIRKRDSAYMPLLVNQGRWNVRAVVDDKGNPVGAFVDYEIFTEPDLGSQGLTRKNGTSDTLIWDKTKKGAKGDIEGKMKALFKGLAAAAGGSDPSGTLTTSCTADLQQIGFCK